VFYYSKEVKNYNFKPTVRLATLGNVIYGVEYLRNKVGAFKLEHPNIKHVFDVYLKMTLSNLSSKAI